MKKTKKKTKRPPSKTTEDILSNDSNFIVRHIALPIVILNAKGEIKNCNEGWMKLWGKKGCKTSDCLGINYIQFLENILAKKLISLDTKQTLEGAVKKALKPHSKAFHFEYQINKDWYWSNINSMKSGNRFYGLVISHHNATNWKKREWTLENERKESLETSQRKMFFLANLNHELKSPLNAITGFSQLLKEHINSDKNLDRYNNVIENIIEGASHLNSIVLRILNMAKIESGTLTLQEERVTPAKLIQLSLNIVQPLYPDRQIQIEVCQKAALETLKCDKNLAMEVLINLMVNSLKFSEAPVRIKCTVTTKRNMEFHVEDNGEGMTEEEVGVALEPFGQNLRSAQDKNTGLGLGVPFCSQIMKLHGGDLKIKSKKGKGTTVCAAFPSSRIDI